MSLFKKAVDKVKKNSDNIRNDIQNCIPTPTLSRMQNYIPGILQGVNYIVTANSGVGKTQFSKHYFVYEPFDWIRSNPKTHLSLKVLYFALEESKEEFMLGVMCRRLFDKHKIEMTPLELQALFGDPVDDDIIQKLEEDAEYFADFEDCVEIIDTVDNPTGIYKHVRRYSYENGTHYYKNHKTKSDVRITYDEYIKMTPRAKGGEQGDWSYSHYVPNDEHEYVIVVVDHFSLLAPEKGADTLHAAMSKMSADYGRKQITKHWKYAFVNVQQQAAETEKQQYTQQGATIESKLEPSLAGLGDNKLTARDAHIVFGVFAPHRYSLSKHAGYDVKSLQDNYRSLIILKNRIGRSDFKIGMNFRGDINKFHQLPQASQMTQKYYEDVIEGRNKRNKKHSKL